MRALAVLVVVTMVGAAACGDGGSGPEGPVPGDAIVVLDGAASDDGAVLLEIGPGATGVVPGRAGLVAHALEDADGGGLVVAVFGSLAGGPLLRVMVPDRAALPTLAVREVANGTGQLRPTLVGYTLRVDEVR